jgi:DNA primase
MDAIAAHQHGLGNVVASMGTSLTERQVNLIKRYTRNLALALDADLAGSEATLRGVQVAANALDKMEVPVPDWRGIIRHQEVLAADIKVIPLPPGKDPDQVIRSDPHSWQQLVAQATPVLDHLFEAVTSKLDLSQPRQRSQAVSELLPLVAAVPDQVVRAHYVQQLARLAQVDEETLRVRLRRRPPSHRLAQTEDESAPAPPREPREEFCLALLLRHAELREHGMTLSPELFTMAENRGLLEAWQKTADLIELRESLLEDLRGHLERILEKDLPVYESRQLTSAFDDCIWRLEQHRLSLEKRAIASLVAESQVEAGSIRMAEIAGQSWQSGSSPQADTQDKAVDPAAVLIQDMERGRQVHQRLKKHRRKGVQEPSPDGEEP